MLKCTNTLTLILYTSLIFKAYNTQQRLKSSKCNVLRKNPDDVDADNDNDDVDDDDDNNDDKDYFVNTFVSDRGIARTYLVFH